MRARLKLFRAHTDGGIHAAEWIDDEVLGKISIEETVGDEFFIKSSEITIEIRGELPRLISLPLMTNWIAVYFDDLLFNVYQHPGVDNWLSRDDKTGLRKYRLFPLQKIFYDHLASTALEYSTEADSWNENISDALVEIDSIEVLNELGTPESTTDRWGFALSYLIEALAGQNNDYGYQVGLVNHPMVAPTDDDLAIIWRGLSKAPGFDTEEDMINFTFKESDLGGGEVFNMTWLDIFKMVIFGWNAFIRVTPDLNDDQLTATIDVIPKVSLPASGAIAEVDVAFFERKKIRERYKLAGVKLTGTNFSYTSGNPQGANVLTRDIAVSDYEEPIESFSVALYWAAGDYNFGDSQYELTAPYFSSFPSLVTPYYLGFTTLGDAYEAKARLVYIEGGEKKILHVLDQIVVTDEELGTEVFHINTIRADGNGKANLEGIVIYTP